MDKIELTNDLHNYLVDLAERRSKLAPKLTNLHEYTSIYFHSPGTGNPQN